MPIFISYGNFCNSKNLSIHNCNSGIRYKDFASLRSNLFIKTYQWAAVTTQCGLTIDPPHPILILTINGHASRCASYPPTIRESTTPLTSGLLHLRFLGIRFDKSRSSTLKPASAKLRSTSLAAKTSRPPWVWPDIELGRRTPRERAVSVLFA